MKKMTTLFTIAILAFVFAGMSTQAQSSIDSVRIDSISTVGLNPSTQMRVHVHYYNVHPSGSYRINYGIQVNDTATGSRSVNGGTDTTSQIITGLMTSTTYYVDALFSYPAPKVSRVVTHTTSACSFQASFTVDTTNRCKHNLTADQIGTCQWKLSGNNIPGATGQVYPATITGNYSVAITIGGCTSISSAEQVTVPGLSDKSEICLGSLAALSAVVANPSGNESFFWTSTPSGFTSADQNVTVTPNITTTYKVTVSDAGCSAIATVKVIVNKNNSQDKIIASSDSACHNTVQNINLIGTPPGGIFSGVGVSGNLLIPMNVPVGAAQPVYTTTDANGCKASATTTVWILDVPVADSVKVINGDVIVYGYFPYPIYIEIGNKVSHTNQQNSAIARFTGVTIGNGDLIVISSSTGGCFILYQFNYHLGIETDPEAIVIKTGDVIELHGIMSSSVTTIMAPKDFRNNELWEVEKLFRELPTNGMYIWRSGKIVRKFICKQ